jgi:hypothetical protein
MEVYQQHLELEQMRATLRYILGVYGWGRQSTADGAGVSDTVLRAFLEGAIPRPQSVAALRTFCEREGLKPAFPEQVALSILIAGLPPEIRKFEREKIVAEHREAFQAHGSRVPYWIDYEQALTISGDRVGVHASINRREALLFLAREFEPTSLGGP